MKKTIFGFLFVMAAFGVFGQTGQLSGVIRELSGTVELKNPGASGFVAAKAGDTISQDTIISTGFRSTALVVVGSATINVQPLTRLALSEIAASAGMETINLNLQAGRVRVDLTPPQGTRAAMQVSSPVATASVRGTSFEFDTRNLSVSSGTVSFSGNRGKQTLVHAGSTSRVEANGSAADPVRTKSQRLRPTPPVGTDVNSGNTGESNSRTGNVITFEFYYHID